MIETEDQPLSVDSAFGEVEPDPKARVRLMAAVEKERYLPFCGRLAALFGLDHETMRGLLSEIDDPSHWTRGVAPIEGFLHFRPGPSLEPLHGGFVRMLGGAWIPSHRHRDREVTFVLEGTLIDGEGRTYGPGQSLEMLPGSVHGVGVGEGSAALLALLHGGIEMLGD